MRNNYTDFAPAGATLDARSPVSVCRIDATEASFVGQNATPHRHNTYEVIWIRSGDGRLTVDLC